MDLLRAKRSIEQEFEDSTITLEYEMLDTRLSVKGFLETGDLGDFMFNVNVYDSGMLSYNLIFNEIKDSPKVHKLLNDFNKDAFLLFAYADEFLMLDHTVYRGLDPDIIGQYTADILDELLDEELKEKLIPLIELTF